MDFSMFQMFPMFIDMMMSLMNLEDYDDMREFKNFFTETMMVTMAEKFANGDIVGLQQKIDEFRSQRQASKSKAAAQPKNGNNSGHQAQQPGAKKRNRRKR